MTKVEWLFELEKLLQVSDGFLRSLERELVPMTLPKNHQLLEAPRVSGHIYYLQEGLAMSYTFHGGERQVEQFWKPGQIIVSFHSFMQQERTIEYIQFMSKADMMCISYDSMLFLLGKYKEAQELYRLIMNQSYDRALSRIRDRRQLTVRQLYEKLLTDYPGIEQHVPQENIASWLGITPQSLSRLKRHTGRG